MTPEDRIKRLEDILGALLKSDRMVLQRTLQMADGRNIQTGRTTGTKIGTASDQKVAFYGATPAIQHSSTGLRTGFVANAGFAVQDNSTFTGNIGSTAYTVGDVVQALKEMGPLAL